MSFRDLPRGSSWQLFNSLDDLDKLGDPNNRTRLRRELLSGRLDQSVIDGISEQSRNYCLRRRILTYAGRQAAASFRIAIPPRISADISFIADEAIFHEPFTYWDWNGYEEDRREPRKRRLLWERERSFVANGDDSRHRFPSPKEQWEAFKERATAHKRNANAVRRLALAAWMTPDDLIWISKHLQNLEALDMSLIAKSVGFQGPPRSETDGRDTTTGSAKEAAQRNWSTYLKYFAQEEEEVDSTSQYLRKLKWLGIPDPRSMSEIQTSIFGDLVERCTSLETVCVRGEYDADTDSRTPNPHKHICLFKKNVIHVLPDSVTAIELRLAIGFMPLLLNYIHESKPHVKHVGIDLGAWVQMYPLRDQSRKKLSDDEVARNAVEAAKVAIGNLLNQTNMNRRYLHNSLLQPGTGAAISEAKRDELKSYFHNKSGTGVQIYTDKSSRHDRDCDIRNVHEEVRDSNRATTLSRMLKKLRHAYTAQSGIEPYALEPEEHARSTDSLNPLALVQEQSAIFKGFGHSFEGQLTKDDYSWLGTSFKWKPVIDWDCLVNPSRVEDCVDPDLVHRSWEVMELLIRSCFERMNQAGIAVHILIGRRDPQLSSCYWGWPYSTWETLSAADTDEAFSAKLGSYAEFIDTLSILYDLRNPLDRNRLEEIERQSPGRKPDAFCPEETCPWGRAVDCPFGDHRRPERTRQRMANGGIINPGVKLAQTLEEDPPPGEIIHLHPPQGQGPGRHGPALHEAARKAVFAREMYGWYRFWRHNALLFTKLTMLRIRMPRLFDNAWSYHLARLLKEDVGWKSVMYTPEVEHAQTREDLNRTIPNIPAETFCHEKLLNKWPAGQFVRRTWVRQQNSLDGDNDPRLGNSISLDVNSTRLETRQALKASMFIEECARQEKQMERGEVKGKGKATKSLQRSESPTDEGEGPAAGDSRSGFTFPGNTYSQSLANHAGNYYRAAIQDYFELVSEQAKEDGDNDTHIELQDQMRQLLDQSIPYGDIFQYDDTGNYQNNIALAGVNPGGYHVHPTEVPSADLSKTIYTRAPPNPSVPHYSNGHFFGAPNQLVPFIGDDSNHLYGSGRDYGIPNRNFHFDSDDFPLPNEEDRIEELVDDYDENQDVGGLREDQYNDRHAPNVRSPAVNKQSEEDRQPTPSNTATRSTAGRTKPSIASAVSSTSILSPAPSNLATPSPTTLRTVRRQREPQPIPPSTKPPSPQTKGPGPPKRKVREGVTYTEPKSRINPIADESTNKRRKVGNDAHIPTGTTQPPTRSRRGRPAAPVAAPAPPSAPAPTARGRAKAGTGAGRPVARRNSEAADTEVDTSPYMSWTVVQLRAELKKKNIALKGLTRKRQFVRALLDADQGKDADSNAADAGSHADSDANADANTDANADANTDAHAAGEAAEEAVDEVEASRYMKWTVVRLRAELKKRRVALKGLTRKRQYVQALMDNDDS